MIAEDRGRELNVYGRSQGKHGIRGARKTEMTAAINSEERSIIKERTNDERFEAREIKTDIEAFDCERRPGQYGLENV
jgi:hypothetical protein